MDTRSFSRRRTVGAAGFSLVEMMVALAIVSMLSAIAAPQLLGARSKSKEARVESDLATLMKAAQNLFDDTGEYPGHLPEQPCSEDVELPVTDCSLGLYCTDGTYENWAGPYIQSGQDAVHEGKDPWGEIYVYDTDYYDGERVGRVFHSRGPNQSGINVYDSDNIVRYICADQDDPWG